jgi:hypothetical protein
VHAEERQGVSAPFASGNRRQTKHAGHDKFSHMYRPVSVILCALRTRRRFLQLLPKSNGVRPKCGQKSKRLRANDKGGHRGRLSIDPTV